MEMVDALAKIKVLNFGGAFTDLPVRDYDENDGKAGEKVTDEHLVMVHNIMILDHDPDSAADLKPVPNTLIHEQPEKPNKSSSSGSVSWWLLGMLLLRSEERRVGKEVSDERTEGQEKRKRRRKVNA